ncbi:heme-binding protein [Sphingomonas sp. IW22]|uniref:GlcG/HbpS family heme-binding protein n=1 Tax=Sphingomonas sp. IW22 TaxID=3242489 RepID=UPI003521FC4F
MALTHTTHTITLDTALVILEKALARARVMKVKLAIAIADRAGHLIALHRDDGTWATSIDVARDKAATAAVFGVSTDELREALSYSQALTEGLARRPGVILFGGGFPIAAQGEIIGGIGASGASEQEERDILTYALEGLNHDL